MAISVRSSEQYILDVSTCMLWNQLPWSQHLKIDLYNTSCTPHTPQKFPRSFMHLTSCLAQVISLRWQFSLPWRHDTTCHTLINPTPWSNQTSLPLCNSSGLYMLHYSVSKTWLEKWKMFDQVLGTQRQWDIFSTSKFFKLSNRRTKTFF